MRQTFACGGRQQTTKQSMKRGRLFPAMQVGGASPGQARAECLPPKLGHGCSLSTRKREIRSRFVFQLCAFCSAASGRFVCSAAGTHPERSRAGKVRTNEQPTSIAFSRERKIRCGSELTNGSEKARGCSPSTEFERCSTQREQQEGNGNAAPLPGRTTPFQAEHTETRADDRYHPI